MSNHGWVRVVFVCLSACAAVCLAVCLMAFLTSNLWAESPAGASDGGAGRARPQRPVHGLHRRRRLPVQPRLSKGDLGAVRLYTILCHPDAAAEQDFGLTLWRLEIRGPDDADAFVRAARGRAWLDDQGFAFGEYWWDGRDELGRPVPPGRYQYTFRARFLPTRLAAAAGAPRSTRTSSPRAVTAADEAYASTGDVVVNYDLDERDAARDAGEPRRRRLPAPAEHAAGDRLRLQLLLRLAPTATPTTPTAGRTPPTAPPATPTAPAPSTRPRCTTTPATRPASTSGSSPTTTTSSTTPSPPPTRRSPRPR